MSPRLVQAGRGKLIILILWQSNIPIIFHRKCPSAGNLIIITVYGDIHCQYYIKCQRNTWIAVQNI